MKTTKGLFLITSMREKSTKCLTAWGLNPLKFDNVLCQLPAAPKLQIKLGINVILLARQPIGTRLFTSILFILF